MKYFLTFIVNKVKGKDLLQKYMRKFKLLKRMILSVMTIAVTVSSIPLYTVAYKSQDMRNKEKLIEAYSENHDSNKDLIEEIEAYFGNADSIGDGKTTSGNDGTTGENETTSGNNGEAEGSGSTSGNETSSGNNASTSGNETSSENHEDTDESDPDNDELTTPSWISKKPAVKLKRATHDGFILSITMKNVIAENQGNLYYKIVAESLTQDTVSENNQQNTLNNGGSFQDDEWPLKPSHISEDGKIKVYYKLFEGATTEAFIKVSEAGQGKEKYKITVSLLQTKKKQFPIEKIYYPDSIEEDISNDHLFYESDGSISENIVFSTISGKEGKLNNVTTKVPRYETKLTLQKKKNRVFLGEKDVYIGDVVFSKNTTYVGVEKIYLYSAPGVWDTDNLPMEVDVTPQGKITVNVKEDATPGIYVIAALPEADENMYAIPAYLQIEVARNIYHIDLKIPQTIYKPEGKKTGFKAGITYNEGYQYLAPKTKKVTWTILDSKGVEITKEHLLYKIISVKNGKVSIHKNYTFTPGENNFTLCARAADYIGNEVKALASFEITREPLAMGETAIVKRLRENTYRQIDLHQKSLSANDLENSRIVVLKPGTEQKDILTEEDFMENRFTYQSSRPKEVTVDEKGNITVLKVVKNVKFTVKADDGSGGSKVINKMAVTHSPIDNIGLLVKKEDYTTGSFEQISFPSQYMESGTVSGANELYGIKDTLLQVEVVNQENGAKESFSNHKLKVKGGKIISKDGFGMYHISMTSDKLILTLTNLNNGDVKTYEYVNKSFSYNKAVKLTTTDKVSAFTHAEQTVTYTLPSGETGKYEYVLVTPDTTQKIKNMQPNILQSLSKGSIGIPIKMEGKGSFDLTFEQKTDEMGIYKEILPFHYRLNITFGHLNEKNQFVADAKPLPISLLVREPMTVKTKTLSLAKQYKIKSTGEGVPLKLKEEGKILMLYGLKDDNVKGRSNNFTDLFTLEGNMIRLKTGSDINYTKGKKYTGWIEGGLYTDENGQTGYLHPTKITIEIDRH